MRNADDFDAERNDEGAVETKVDYGEHPAFVAFGAWLDEDIDRLVARWIHMASPNSQRPRRPRRRQAGDKR